jgi:hypothetical protein
MQNDTRIAVHLAKTVFEIAVSNRPGRVSRRERLPRAQFLNFFALQQRATVVMEACGSAHYWGRRMWLSRARITRCGPGLSRPTKRPEIRLQSDLSARVSV